MKPALRPESPSAASAEQAVMDGLRAGYRDRDAALLASLYREDAEFVIVNRNNPPSKRLVVHGREGVRKLLDDICSREMTHELTQGAVSPGSIAFLATCRYPDGCCVIGITIATVEDGLISREITIDCWDE